MKNNLSIKQKKKIAATVLCIGLIGMLWHMIFILVVLATSLLLLGQFHHELHRAKNIKAIESALPMLDGIFSGRRYIGKESEVVDTIKYENQYSSKYPISIEQLCKTKAGNWFKFKFSTKSGTGIPYDFSVIPLNELDARYWLEKNQALYHRFFGDPELA